MLARIGLLRLVVAVALGSLALAVSPCFADEWEREEERRPVNRSVNSIHAGATSVQFLTFGGGSTGPFRTTGIYLKTHFSDRGALRAGVDFGLSNATGSTRPTQNSLEGRSYSISVSAELDEYVDTKGPVTIFFGVGPYWTMGREKYDQTFTSLYDPSYSDRYTDDIRYWEVGGSAAAGFEWFFTRKLSLLGRVGGSFGFGKQRRNSFYSSTTPFGTQEQRTDGDLDTARGSTSSSALGLGIYF